MTQSSFEFDAPPSAAPTAADPPAPPAPPASPAPPVRPASPAPADLEDIANLPNLEAMAKRLEQEPDFRVLRRLVPRMDFGPAPPASEPAQAATELLRVLVLDTETTGLSHQSDKIIELAMLLVDVNIATGEPFGPVDVYEGFEDPGMPIPAVALQVTGIDDDMVKGQRLDDAQVEAMVARADLIIAHNAGFDRPFVEARYPSFANKSWACSFMDIDWQAAGAGSSKLSALAIDQGWFYDAHRAQVDCHALLQVLTRAVAGTTTTGLRQLIDAAGQPSFKLHATGSPFETKDKLKERGYRWDAEGKVWYCTLPSQQLLDAELEWLKKEVYGRRNVRPDVEEMDSTVRYSTRRGKTINWAS